MTCIARDGGRMLLVQLICAFLFMVCIGGAAALAYQEAAFG